MVSLVTTPFLRPFRWSNLIWAYLIPIVPFVLLFDGVVSCIRTYSPRELAELTKGLSSKAYAWKMGEEEAGLSSIPITSLIGYPIAKQEHAGQK